jgi:hypothetical protein
MKSGKMMDRANYIKAEGKLFIFIWAISLSIILFPFLSNAATPPRISVKPTSINLGLVKVGGVSTPRMLAIKNTGQSDLVITSIIISGTNASEFGYSPTNGCTNPIPTNASCQVSITFTPTSPFGKKSAIMSISSNDPKKPSIKVHLLGQAPTPTITISPTSVNFGSVAVGNTSVPKVITIKNTGISDLIINSITFTGTNAAEFGQTNDCSTLAKGGSCAITVTLSPTSAVSKSALMSISTNDPKKQIINVKLSGKGSGGGGGATDNNVVAITVNGPLCSNDSYVNKPCVSVTVCTPGTSTCQTIDDILLDTGSSGLRIFQQVLNVSLVQVTIDSGSLAECVQYADGSSDWGPIQIASVILGNEPAVQVPIQVIDSTFGTLPVACRNADQSPADAGFNGILGVGLFAQDCGSGCSNSSDNGMYYVCNGSGCQGTAVSLSSQGQNPVALLPQDNNGVIVELPSVPLGGTSSVNGYLVLGIGTQTNNVPSAVKTYTANQYGEFTTKFNRISYSSFLDTGSNGLFFPSPSSNVLPDCAYPDSGWFCPSSTKSFSATNKGSSGSPSGTVSFQIGYYDSLTTSSNNAFAEIGGDGAGEFDWGLPFYFGRNVYVGLEGTESSLGSGLYWAY